jgi:hypothetical protein
MPDENGLACAPAAARETSRRLGTRASAVGLTWEHSAPRTDTLVERDQSLKLVPALASELPKLVARRRFESLSDGLSRDSI